MKRTMGLIIALASLLSTTAFSQSAPQSGKVPWFEFFSKEGAFSALMPSKPTQEVQKTDTDLGKLDYHLVVGSDEEIGVFIVAYSDFPSVVTERDAIQRILEGAQNQLLANKERKLLSETTIALDGHVGRELRLEVPDGSMITRIYWVRRRLYQLIAITPKDKPAPQVVAKFLSSFKLISDAHAALQSPNWFEFSSEEGRFTILMPTTPAEQVMPVQSTTGSLSLHTYVSLGTQGVVYIATYSDLPTAPTDQSQIIKVLDDVRNGQLTKAKGKLQSEVTISLDGHPGRELRIDTPVGPSIVRNFLVNRRLYQVVVVVPEAKAGSKDVAEDTATFLSSFKLLGR